MTTERTYRCNLCRDGIEVAQGVGVHFSDMTNFKFVALRDAENHLCNDCIERIVINDSARSKAE